MIKALQATERRRELVVYSSTVAVPDKIVGKATAARRCRPAKMWCER
jgi:hypothetical protein